MHGTEMYIDQHILMRPRLHALLSEAAGYPLCTVTAGTGYGKSRAVSSFLQAGQERYVWLQLTDMDNYIPRFWEIATHAVGAVDAQIAKQLQALGFPNTPELLYKFVQILQRALAGGRRLYMVLDDFHKIEEPAIVRLVETLAFAEIDNLNIFLVTRQPAPLDYFSLYNNGLLHRISEDDLRFTYEEIEEYYRLLGFAFTPRVLTNVYESTEGWPMALYLIGLHKAGDKGQELDPLSFTMPFLNSLFEVEVFAAYEPVVQDLLVKLSLPEAVPMEVVKEIAGAHLPVLQTALSSNMFVSYNPSVDNQYVFHRLFRRFLKPRRDALPAVVHQNVYNLMADWYYKQGRCSEALDYYEKSGNHAGQWAVMQHYAMQDYVPEVAARCIVLAENFPPEFVAQNIMVIIHKGYMYLNLGRVEESARTFETVLESAHGDESVAASRLAGEAWLGLAPARIFQQSWEFAACFANAAKLLPHGSEYMTSGNHYLGNSNVLPMFGRAPGALDKMAQTMAEIWPVAAKVMNGCGSGMEHLAATEAAFYRGRYEDAIQSAHKALFSGAAHGQQDIACASYFVLVRIYFAKGDFKKTMQYLQEMEQYLQDSGAPHAWGVDGLAKAWLYQRMGDFDAIPNWAYGEPLTAGGVNVVAVSRERVVETDRKLREGKYDEVLAGVDILLDIYRGQGAIFSEVKTHLHKAVALLRLGRREDAVQAFVECCAAAMPNDIRESFIEEGEAAIELIDLLQQAGAGAEYYEWLAPLRGKAKEYARTEKEMREAYALHRNQKPT